MSYPLSVLADKPLALWLMDEARSITNNEPVFNGGGLVPSNSLTPSGSLLPSVGTESQGLSMLVPGQLVPSDSLMLAAGNTGNIPFYPATTIFPDGTLYPGSLLDTGGTGGVLFYPTTTTFPSTALYPGSLPGGITPGGTLGIAGPLTATDPSQPTQTLDWSPYHRVATPSGSLIKNPSVVADALFSSVVHNSLTVSFESPVFLQGYEKSAFALEAWVYPIVKTTSGEQGILSHSNQYDGLTINDTVVSFTTKYLTSGECRVSYDIQRRRGVHVVGIHTAEQNLLYVDGELVGTTNITDAQELDSFIATAPTLVAGQSSSNRRLAINGIGLYDYNLNSIQIKNHFQLGRRVTPAETVVAPYGGNRLTLDPDLLNIQIFNEDEDWATGEYTNVAIENDMLTPAVTPATDVSLAGTWLGAVYFDAATAPVSGVVLDWEGQGITVATSLDTVTWTTAVNGQKIAVPYNPTDDLSVRISFAGGIVDDPSYISSLTASVYSSSGAPTVTNRTVTGINTSFSPFVEPIEYDEAAGVYMNSGTLTIGPDTSSAPVDSRTLEFWIKKNSGTVSVSVTGTTYSNGLPGAPVYATGEWELIHIVASSNISGAIEITSTGVIGGITLYESALTAAQIANIYAAYTGIPSATIVDPTILNVTVPLVASKIYAYEWAITGAG